ncbi:unnamed protein product, partial [Rotaria sp. Silwood2]
SPSLGLDYPANCPNLLSGYIYINPNNPFRQDYVLSWLFLCLYVIDGHETTKIFDKAYVNWSKGDLLVIPYQIQRLEHFILDETTFHYAQGRILLKYR